MCYTYIHSERTDSNLFHFFLTYLQLVGSFQLFKFLAETLESSRKKCVMFCYKMGSNHRRTFYPVRFQNDAKTNVSNAANKVLYKKKYIHMLYIHRYIHMTYIYMYIHLYHSSCDIFFEQTYVKSGLVKLLPQHQQGFANTHNNIYVPR
jgi:hypothetical protein